MFKNFKQIQKFNQSNTAVLGLPMTLVITIIVSTIIFSLYATGADYFITFHQEQQIKNCIAEICDQVSIMKAYGSTESQMILDLKFPPLTDVIIFGSDSFYDVSNDTNQSYYTRSYVCFQLKNGHSEIIPCPVAFCNDKYHPLVFHSGSYKVLFSLSELDEKVIVIGSIMQ
jgi:hypothetical protein